MKKALKFACLLLFLSTYLPSGAQGLSTSELLDSIIHHAETHSLYREKVDWDTLRAEMHGLAKGADSVPALKPAIEWMLEQLGDTHGRVFHNNRYLAYYTGGEREHRRDMDGNTYNEIQSGQVYPFMATLLQDGIGYVRIIGLPMGDNERMSSEIQDAVCAVIAQGARDWIVDLRYNGGGNMFPMVEGITGIIGDGIVGGTAGISVEESSVWSIVNGDFFYDQQTVALENSCGVSQLPRIAVLTSVYTASSGEALAVILKHRPNTRFFGSKTLGLVTVTDWKQLDDRTAMSISVSYYQDRSGTIYTEYVDVEEYVAFNPKAKIENDPGIERAVQWLNE